MRNVFDDLWETDTESPFPGLLTHAYLWTGSEAGNILFYGTSHLHELDAMTAHGGVARQYLSHQDEAGSFLATVKQRFGSTLHVPRAEAETIGMHATIDAVFDGHVVEPSRVEVIPTPGHTPGSTCFVVASAAGGTYLFTGDLVFMGVDGRWAAGYIAGMSDRDDMRDSIARLRDLRPDVVISSAAPTGEGLHVLGETKWAGCVDEALESLER